ncbi:hypothetical protein PR202_gb00233 [Eleusine coracana subsp. coracana]|uniref:Uncharacterized protein n=1 Tax=Eleusine coracana subsp. coracana TaxID=191504 RepID=A0AAV5DSX7_ELECO|nr:hypothetical protein PR202_gb00233 [Eleusine coracana subsp. coracana]
METAVPNSSSRPSSKEQEKIGSHTSLTSKVIQWSSHKEIPEIFINYFQNIFASHLTHAGNPNDTHIR